MKSAPIAIVVAAALFFAVSPSSAEAQEPSTDELFARHHELGVNMGILSAVGFGGLTYALSPAPWIALEAGVGCGFSGLQLSGMVRPSLALGRAAHRLLLGGIGASVGLGKKPDSNVWEYWIQEGETYVWLNVDLAGYTRRFANGLFVTAAVGLTVGLDGQYDTCIGIGPCEPNSEESIRGMVLPQGRVTFGYSF